MDGARGSDGAGARATDRAGMLVMRPSECEEKLASGEIGRVGFEHAGEVVILPVTYRYHDHRIYFRTAAGEKLDTAIMRRRVAFEVDDFDPQRRSGWSVLVQGRASTVYDDDVRAALDGAGLEPWAAADAREIVVSITTDEMSGRWLPPAASDVHP